MKRTTPASREMPSDPFLMTKDLRLSQCLYCGHPKHDKDAIFCTMCGSPVVNACPECAHRNIAVARYCELCGERTVFFMKGILPPYDEDVPVPTEYHTPPAPPEGYYTREKREEAEYALKRKEHDKRLQEWIKEFLEDDGEEL